MRKQLCINTIKMQSPVAVVRDEDLALAKSSDFTQDISLSKQIVSDLEYGVGNRPSLPSCFDDDAFWKSGQVDSAVDVRRSKWDDLADACNPNAITPAEQPKVETEDEV